MYFDNIRLTVNAQAIFEIVKVFQSFKHNFFPIYYLANTNHQLCPNIFIEKKNYYKMAYCNMILMNYYEMKCILKKL